MGMSKGLRGAVSPPIVFYYTSTFLRDQTSGLLLMSIK